MIWEPFVLALVLGFILSAGLYVAYVWPEVEPTEPDDGEAPVRGAGAPADPPPPQLASTASVASDDAASPAP